MAAGPILFVIPPLTQLNTPYPSTAHLTGFLRSRHYRAFQADIGIEMVLTVFSRHGLTRIFDELRSKPKESLPGEARQMLSLADVYVATIEPVIQFLQGHDHALAPRICQGQFLPEGPRFSYSQLDPVNLTTISKNQTDYAKHLASLYLEDLVDLIQATITPHFALSRYAESVASHASSYDGIQEALAQPLSLPDQWMLEAFWNAMEKYQPAAVGFSVPFPGNLYGALRMGQALKQRYPEVAAILGGGYVNTELRRLQDPRLFEVMDFVTLDDGRRPLLCLLEHLQGMRPSHELCRTFLRSGNGVLWRDGASEERESKSDESIPTYEGLDLRRYFSVLDTLNPMHRLWSDGHWNKLVVAHGCYWKQCTFCDVDLDYIQRYEVNPTARLIHQIESLIQESGTRGFHFVDEAAPPVGLKNLALALLERQLSISWWGNIRFETAFTPDLCRLLSASGCIALTAGLEAACDRLLDLVQKGITVDQTVRMVSACQKAGILVHAYLMYGLPGETRLETMESLERVRQLFVHGLIQSAFWHKFTATAHSPIGLNPQQYGIQVMGPTFQGFAENDLIHEDPRAAVSEAIGEGLRTALWHYKEGKELRRDVREWFAERMPLPKVPKRWVHDILRARPPKDHSQFERKFVWIGGQPDVENGKGVQCRIFLSNRIQDKQIRLQRGQAMWFLNLLQRATPQYDHEGHRYPVFKEVRAGYPFGGPKGFDRWWKSTSATKAKEIGLLLI